MIDLVICGPDMSGTSTQIEDLAQHCTIKGLKVRDLRGTELDAIFHAHMFSDINSNHPNLKSYLRDPRVDESYKDKFRKVAIEQLHGHITGADLKVPAMAKADAFTYIDPKSADVWVMEEPPRRGAGQINRTIEQNRTSLGLEADPVAASHAHAAYRYDEFYRFRKHLREANRIIIRSRSEESACYQVHDPVRLPDGIQEDDYLGLPGHKIAFANPPTDLFIVCAKPGWPREKYEEFRKQRSNGRKLDDYESSTQWQLLVNDRYATGWLEELYMKASPASRMPNFHRFDIHTAKEEMKFLMNNTFDGLVTMYWSKA